MSCSYRNRCLNQALNFETFEHAECSRSTNSLHHLCQIKYEGDNAVYGGKHKHREQCDVKKHNTYVEMILEDADSSHTNDDDASISNEGNITINNKQRSFKGLLEPMLFCLMKEKK